MGIQETFPSGFAIRLAESVKLVLKEKHSMSSRSAEYYEKLNALQEFQNMAISCSFKQALLAFHGIKINSSQRKTLKTIFKSSKPFLLGANVSIMIRKLESPTCTGRDAKEITAAIVEYLQGENEKGNGAGQLNAGFHLYAAPIPPQS